MTDPASILTSLNHDLVDPAASETFATLVLAVIDGNRHELTLASAGHVAPFLRDADRRIESLGEDAQGSLFGLIQHSTMKMSRHQSLLAKL